MPPDIFGSNTALLLHPCIKQLHIYSWWACTEVETEWDDDLVLEAVLWRGYHKKGKKEERTWMLFWVPDGCNLGSRGSLILWAQIETFHFPLAPFSWFPVFILTVIFFIQLCPVIYCRFLDSVNILFFIFLTEGVAKHEWSYRWERHFL